MSEHSEVEELSEQAQYGSSKGPPSPPPEAT